jgi:hypothetical protein
LKNDVNVCKKLLSVGILKVLDPQQDLQQDLNPDPNMDPNPDPEVHGMELWIWIRIHN